MKIKYSQKWSISEIFKCADYRCCFRTNCHGCCSLYNSLCREVSGTTDHPLSSFQEAATMMGKNFGDTWGNFCRFSENLFKTKQPQKSIYTRLWLLSLSLNSDQMSCTEMKIISISVQHICNCDSSSTSLARLSSASRSLPALSGLKWWDYGYLERCYRCETEESAFYKQLLYYKNVHI